MKKVAWRLDRAMTERIGPMIERGLAMLINGLKACWWLACELSGDNAYAHYLAHHAKTHPRLIPLGRKEFSKQQQERKWNQVNRCC